MFFGNFLWSSELICDFFLFVCNFGLIGGVFYEVNFEGGSGVGGDDGSGGGEGGGDGGDGLFLEFGENFNFNVFVFLFVFCGIVFVSEGIFEWYCILVVVLGWFVFFLF